ncbi:MAG: glycosyltransferase [Paludibacter sp.]|jgi:glycosyltransferase involved in cell wall biosynthesis|nr:glycosyltransferase [Paludibacter sp.]
MSKVNNIKTAIVCVTNDLTTDQRVHKTCLALQKAGYRVVETGRVLPDSLPLTRPYRTRRKKHFFNSGALFYAEYNLRLFFYLLLARVDLIFANDLDTLPAAFLAAKIRRKKLIYDTHEYFTEVPELVTRPKIQRIWQKIERFIFPKLNIIITVNNSIAALYEEKYNKKITVVRNIPLYKPFVKSELLQTMFPNKKTLLYQGAINLGRGLEYVIDALPLLDDVVLAVIGAGDIENDLKAKVKHLHLEDKVHFLGKKTPEELYKFTASAHIGLCLLEDLGLNYHYALPNRIFDYMQAQIPVLATDFPEIEKVVNTYHTGVLINHYEPKYIAEIIDKMLKNPIDKVHFEQPAKELCWENEEKILLNLINKTDALHINTDI